MTDNLMSNLYKCPKHDIRLFISGYRSGEPVYYCKECREFYEESQLKNGIRCKTCNIRLNINKTFVRAFKEQRCNKCYMESRTDEDRTGRSSKKDRYKNKDIRERMY
jgi:DNA-directed RNA polymerase subunit RPC12/RpoP